MLYCDLVACFCCLCLYSLRRFGLVRWFCLYCACLVALLWFRMCLLVLWFGTLCLAGVCSFG